MSLQTIVDQQALDHLPRIKKLVLEQIEKEKFDEAKKMVHVTIYAATHTATSVFVMTKEQLNTLQDDVEDCFKIVGWI